MGSIMSAASALAMSEQHATDTPVPDSEPSVQIVDGGDKTIAERDWSLDENAFRRLSDMLLLPASMLPPQERAFAIDILQAALEYATAEVRRQLAERLSRMGKIAPSLVLRLARDEELSVATPVLRLSEAISNADLIDILKNWRADRAMIIASRSVLPSDVASEIANLGDDAALAAALENPGAVFEPGVVAHLAERVRNSEHLATLLLERPEMIPACALDLFWSVNRRLKFYILTRFLQDSPMVQQIIQGERTNSVVVVSGPGGVELAEDTAACELTDAMRVSKAQDRLQDIASLMAKSELEKASEALARLTSVSMSTASAIVSDFGGEAVAVAFKAAGATRATLAQCCEKWLRHEQSPFETEDDAAEVTAQFERMSRGQARMAMTYWDWRRGNVGTYAPNPASGGINELL